MAATDRETLGRIEALERRIGYRFSEPGLLISALTHPSLARREGIASFERMETLGDSVLGFLVSSFLFDRFPDAGPGELTLRRSQVVSGASLVRVADEIGLDEFVRVGEGVKVSPAVLEDVVEALVGALFLDGGLAEADIFFERAFAEVLQTATGEEGSGLDPKSRLQDFSQRSYGLLPEYRLASEGGPPHRKAFRVEVFVKREFAGEGVGPSKKAAEREAARDACARLLARPGDQPRERAATRPNGGAPAPGARGDDAWNS